MLLFNKVWEILFGVWSLGVVLEILYVLLEEEELILVIDNCDDCILVFVLFERFFGVLFFDSMLILWFGLIELVIC